MNFLAEDIFFPAAEHEDWKCELLVYGSPTHSKPPYNPVWQGRPQ